MRKVFYVILIPMFLASCVKEGQELNNANNTGKGGSFARFAVVDNVLYTVNKTGLKIFNIANPNDPQPGGNYHIGPNIETIFPRDNNTLFIGSTSGMYIYDVTNKSLPSRLSEYSHIVACDPVTADMDIACVTLRSEPGSRCGRTTNSLDVINIKDLRYPLFVKSYQMTHPFGLSIRNKNLFVCDNGLKWYDATYPDSLILKKHYNIGGKDLIIKDDIIMMISDDGLRQFKIQGDSSLTLLSTIEVKVPVQ